MKTSIRSKHSMDSLFMILLFGFFVLFLLLLLLFSARTYQGAVNGQRENNELRTAMSYITTKVHQHENAEDVFLGEVEDLPALCMKDTIEDRDFITYIFLDEENMRELFTSADRVPVKGLGTPFCPMTSFEITEASSGLLQISLADTLGHTGTLFLHPGTPEGGAQ